MSGSDAPQSVSLETQKHDPSYLGEAVNLLSASFTKDPQTQAQIELYGTGLLKTAGLFLRNRIGLATTIGTHALGEMHRSDDFGTQALDAGLGSLKGIGTRALFTRMPASADFATKGVVMGTGSRFLEAGLTRDNYLDGTGAFDLGVGVKNAQRVAMNGEAWAADVVTFGLAHGGMVGINRLTKDFVSRSPMLSTMLTGTTFGASTGAYREIDRQQKAGEEFDLGKIATSAAIQGAVDTFAAIPGGLQADRGLRNQLWNAGQSQKDRLTLSMQSFGDKMNAGMTGTELAMASANNSGVKPWTVQPESVRLPEIVPMSHAGPITLDAVVRQSVAKARPTLNFFDAPAVVPESITQMAERVTPIERQQSMRHLLDIAKQPYESGMESRVSAAYDAAAAIGKVDPALFRKEFYEPLVAQMGNREQHYGWRVFAASRFAGLERQGRLPAEMQPSDIPDLRMKARELSPEQQTGLRDRSEAALHDAKALAKMLGPRGELGQLFPEVFGRHDTAGGIMGRPQHGGHDYTVGGHTVHVLRNIRNHPMFEHLSQKDQTNLLWAGLMHDVGKRANVYDPGHEAMSYNAAWGVLQTMGYSPQRIHRITDLMYRHSDVSFNPEAKHSQRMQDPYQLDDTAILHRHDPAVMQLRIMNEADIRAVRKHEALWTDEVRKELDLNATALAYGAQRLSENTVPVLTAELPQRFGIYDMPKDGSLMVHTSPYMQNGTFFRHLSLIESPHYSGSASLVNREHMHLYDSKADFTAVFAAPPEHVSQAHRTGLWTGESMGWNSHVIMAREWSKSDLASTFAAEANAKLQQLGFGRDGSQTALQSYRSQLAKYDTVTEMLAANGKDSPLARAHEAITQMYTRYEDGRPTGTYNEFKINNPAVAGIGVMSRGRQVVLEDPYGPVLPESPNVLVIPKHMWQEAQSRNLPFIVLDAP